MRITVVAVGTRMPRWVVDGVDAYRKRFPRHVRLDIDEVPAGRRTARASAEAAIREEEERLLRRVQQSALVVALDERGRQRATAELAAELRAWLDRSADVAILIGGPDGLSEACRQRADSLWSLSRLTLPHGLVRVMLVEQLYRAWTILQGHPYHRD